MGKKFSKINSFCLNFEKSKVPGSSYYVWYFLYFPIQSFQRQFVWLFAGKSQTKTFLWTKKFKRFWLCFCVGNLIVWETKLLLSSLYFYFQTQFFWKTKGLINFSKVSIEHFLFFEHSWERKQSIQFLKRDFDCGKLPEIFWISTHFEFRKRFFSKTTDFVFFCELSIENFLVLFHNCMKTETSYLCIGILMDRKYWRVPVLLTFLGISNAFFLQFYLVQLSIEVSIDTFPLELEADFSYIKIKLFVLYIRNGVLISQNGKKWY